ncbi:hypothetical protein JOF56_003731 [Kibdelosporangium banguiense]|uniref:Uncharacterized protein n=1 Tax=Kibdelosporangium banguiense TaxID=1365924 RepID=A0ABS4TG89_9PSEU|nr:hypothetical protein [Kibdelosporangium banguiense]MBP2323346.1 hypothetical protein [Kibdelosporangium banguiense]
MPVQDPAKQLARQLADLQRQVSSLSRGSQASHRSIEGGAIAVYDEEGNLRGTVGQLPDGTTGFITVNGPPPPMPSAPILEPTVGGLAITWDGSFFGGAEKPGDFHRLEVHASTYSVYTPNEATHRVDLIGPGTANLILPPSPWTVVFVAVSTADTRSESSISATETPEQAPTYTEVIAANGKNKVFWRKDNAAPTVVEDKLVDGDLWFQADHDFRPMKWDAATSAWVAASFGDQALSGLNVGKLVAGEIAAGQKIIAGPQFGTHAEMASDGFRVYRQDEVEGGTDEVVRLGTSTNDYFAVVNANGELVASVDDTGQGNFSGLNVSGDPVIQGTPLSAMLDEKGGAVVGWFANAFANDYGPIRDAIGVCEVSAIMRKNHLYEISVRLPWRAMVEKDEIRVFVTRRSGTDGTTDTPTAPLASDERLVSWYTTTEAGGRYQTFSGQYVFQPGRNARYRFLLALERGVGTGDAWVLGSQQITLQIRDLGPSIPSTGQFTQGGGSFYQGPPPPPPPPPVQQYYVDLGAVGKASWRGNGSLRTDLGGNEVVQGHDPSGYNGDGRGMWWFNLPVITGTVDRVDVYLYSSHWYYNSGGTVIMNISDQRGLGGDFFRFRGDWHVGGYPKPGGKTVTVPGDWFPLFRGTNNDNYNGRATCITVGPGYGTNFTYYGRFTDIRLRIWYTQ